MKLRHRKLFTTATAVVLVLLSSVYPSFAGEGGAGTTIYKNQADLGNGVTYTNTISQNSTYGIQAVSYTHLSENLDFIFRLDDVNSYALGISHS